MSDIAIQAEKLSKRYTITPGSHRHDTLYHQLAETLKSPFRRDRREKEKDFWALQDISFEARKGEALGIIGHNGAGKSTLLKILSRITEPTSGRVRIYGRVGSLLEVGTGFHPELTGRENIFLNGAIIGMKREEIHRLFDAIVDFAEIEEFIDTPVKRYSSGMYVRLAFAVSAHLRPEILIIDEVLSVGDLQFQRKCTNYAEELQKSGSTILLVSHNMFSVKALCNRVLYLSHGKLLTDGSPEEVIPQFEKEGSSTSSSSSSEGDVSISITDVELFDESGKERAIFDFGERMRIRLHYTTPQVIHNPNFVVALIRSDDVACCNYSTALDGYSIPTLSGEGILEVITPPLKLVSEAYEVHVLVWDKDFQRPYCFQKGLRFHVRHHLFSTHFGVFHEDAEWSVPTGLLKINPGSSQEVCCHD
ncbi:ABC transporter ATP-binding protein [Pelotalea chapellei]|uniref:ABC transporter ATP-binding protein n=1 Tax=Pelotalea chapellei TaxID=44671 RepID=A0ABS5U5D2_9BACT|nr:ABC transporter ATP-binding protein [Pelotalea chapellei]MBT1070857.1 ABC transporter ATP-binding protein [Pelotalea chapellei]